MKIVVTGATGFIGRTLVRTLEEKGHDLHVIVRRPAPQPACASSVLEVVGEIQVTRLLDRLKAESMINLAAAGVKPQERDLKTLTQTNVDLPTILVGAAKKSGLRSFVHIGSSAEYAACKHDEPLKEDAPSERTRIYGATKAAGGLLVEASGIHQGIAVGVLRLFNVFGPGEASHRLLPMLVSNLQRGDRVPLSPGTQMRDFLHVDDACDAIANFTILLADTPPLTGSYNIATGVARSVAEFARTVAVAMAADPALLCFGELKFRPDDLAYVVGDPRKFAAATSWKPLISFELGVRLAVEQQLRVGTQAY